MLGLELVEGGLEPLVLSFGSVGIFASGGQEVREPFVVTL